MNLHKLALLILVPSLGASPALVLGDSSEPATENVDEKQKEFEKKLDERLDQLEKRIDELKDKAEKMESKAKEEIFSQIDELQKKKGALRKQLLEMNAAWKDLKSGLQSAMDELEKALRKIESRRGSKDKT